MTKLGEFEGGYGRTGVISLGDGVCALCGKSALCLIVDQSEGEYEPGMACQDCIGRAFTAAQPETRAGVLRDQPEFIEQAFAPIPMAGWPPR